MFQNPDLLIPTFLVGIGATIFMDFCTILRKRLFNTPSLDWALVGRWAGHLPKGQLSHGNIAASRPTKAERLLGWTIHYATGIVFACVLIAVYGRQWLDEPNLLIAVSFGLVTVLAPFLILQPGMGAGFAAAKTSAPWQARFRSLTTHALFGLGLYLATILLRFIHQI